MLEEKKEVIYLRVAKGELQRWMGQGQPMKSYKRVGGFLEGVNTKKQTFKDGDVMFLYLRLRDGEEVYSVQVPLYGGAGPDVVRSLAFAVKNDIDFVNQKKLTIEVYQKKTENKTFTNASLSCDEQQLEWLHLPGGMSREAGVDSLYKDILEYVTKKGGNKNTSAETKQEEEAAGAYHDNPFDRNLQ